MTLNGRSKSWNLVSPSRGSTAKSLTDHFFFLGFVGRFFCILVLGIGGSGAEDGVGSGWRFLLKSDFKNRKNCFNCYFLLWVKMLTACLLPMVFNRQAVVCEVKIDKKWFYPPATRGSSWIFELSGMIVSVNFGLETSLPSRRITAHNSTLSSVFKREAMVMFSDHCTCFSSTSIKDYSTPFFFKTSMTSGKSIPRRLTVSTVGIPFLFHPRRS